MANQLFQEAVDVLNPTRDAAQDAVLTAHEDARCECGHSRGQHDDPVSGDTRCLVVDERSSLGQVFDDGREGDLAYCGCLRFVDARQLTVEDAEYSLLARQLDDSVIGLSKRGGPWLERDPLSCQASGSCRVRVTRPGGLTRRWTERAGAGARGRPRVEVGRS